MTATFILSLDTEIAWGTYSPRALARQRACFDGYRAVFARLIDLLDNHDIAATFAVVGALWDDACPDDIPRPHSDWAADPCTDPTAPHHWYHGRDIIDMIRAARTPHEIGTHTYTHIIADDPATTRTIWEAQLAGVVARQRAGGLPLHSLVYPRNRIAYTDTLTAHGLTCYRGPEQRPYRHWPRPLRRPAHLLDRALAFTPPTYDPARLIDADGLVNLPASMFLMPSGGPRRLIPTRARVTQAQRGLDRAIRRGDVFHLWFHPFNLCDDPPLWAALRQILARVAAERAAGRLRVRTMAAAAADIRARR